MVSTHDTVQVKRCPRSRPHDWTMCPFAHPGEKARRRDPRKYPYSGTACPDYRKTGQCIRGDACCYSHGVFECWLHPTRYRTQLCTDGAGCRRRVCFFAHYEHEVRRPEAAIAPLPTGGGHHELAAEAAAALAQRRASLQLATTHSGQHMTQPHGQKNMDAVSLLAALGHSIQDAPSQGVLHAAHALLTQLQIQNAARASMDGKLSPDMSMNTDAALLAALQALTLNNQTSGALHEALMQHNGEHAYARHASLDIRQMPLGRSSPPEQQQQQQQQQHLQWTHPVHTAAAARHSVDLGALARQHGLPQNLVTSSTVPYDSTTALTVEALLAAATAAENHQHVLPMHLVNSNSASSLQSLQSSDPEYCRRSLEGPLYGRFSEEYSQLSMETARMAAENYGLHIASSSSSSTGGVALAAQSSFFSPATAAAGIGGSYSGQMSHHHHHHHQQQQQQQQPLSSQQQLTAKLPRKSSSSALSSINEHYESGTAAVVDDTTLDAFPHLPSIDTILSELPRSASQVSLKGQV